MPPTLPVPAKEMSAPVDAGVPDVECLEARQNAGGDEGELHHILVLLKEPRQVQIAFESANADALLETDLTRPAELRDEFRVREDLDDPDVGLRELLGDRREAITLSPGCAEEGMLGRLDVRPDTKDRFRFAIGVADLVRLHTHTGDQGEAVEELLVQLQIAGEVAPGELVDHFTPAP